MKTIYLLFSICLLAVLNTSSFAQGGSTALIKPVSTSSETLEKEKLINSDNKNVEKKYTTEMWEQEQIANGATYVILENGQKAFYSSPPKETIDAGTKESKPASQSDKNKTTKKVPNKK